MAKATFRPSRAATAPPRAAPTARASDQVADESALAGRISSALTTLGQKGATRWLKERGEDHLKTKQNVNQPDFRAGAHQQQSQDNKTADHVRQDHQTAARETVHSVAGQGRHEKPRKSLDNDGPAHRFG